MMPTAITSEVTKLKEKVRVLEVRVCVCIYILWCAKFCHIANVQSTCAMAASICMCLITNDTLKFLTFLLCYIEVTCEPQAEAVGARSWNQSAQEKNFFWSIFLEWGNSWELLFFLPPQGPFGARKSPAYNSPTSREPSKYDNTPVSLWLHDLCWVPGMHLCPSKGCNCMLIRIASLLNIFQLALFWSAFSEGS